MTIAGAIALVALAGVLASLGYLHLAPTGLSPIRNPVSQYGITPQRAGYRVATITFAGAGAALAVGIDRALGSRAASVVVLLAIFAAARAAISWFPMDAPGAPPTGTGHAHRLLATAAFGGATAAAFKLASLLGDGGRWHGLAPVSYALGALMAACLAGLLLGRSYPALRARFGLVERGFYVSAIAWFAVFSVACAAKLS
ncbi:MAG TPA: DUF998 domain-containing protein [Solirubrobacteraceae bacterium]|nr:DUF998 domain-containing protein [Solirubrobacteraceae bacterium]